MAEKILFVDDEQNILDSVKRHFRKDFDIDTALGGEAGLEAIGSKGPFAVVVSDMRMPGMNGAQFLAKVREAEPDSVRLMLTGQADMNDTIAAVNEGNIFRFLTKPCQPEVLSKALKASLEQHRLLIAERELLEKTLMGAINVLTELLSLVNPAAYGRASRVKKYVHHIATHIESPKVWQYEMAAMLSQIGCVTLPSDTLLKFYAGQELSDEEQQMLLSHPTVGYKILSKIPRLEIIAHIIEKQQQSFSEQSSPQTADQDESDINLGAQILKAALDFDEFVTNGTPPKLALAKMQNTQAYNPLLLVALSSLNIRESDLEVRTVKVRELSTNMIIDQEVRTTKGQLLLTKGQEITSPVLESLLSISQTVGIEEPFRVLIKR